MIQPRLKVIAYFRRSGPDPSVASHPFQPVRRLPMASLLPFLLQPLGIVAEDNARLPALVVPPVVALMEAPDCPERAIGRIEPVPVNIAGDAIVIRFTPATASKVLQRAELSYRRTGRWFSSVFADSKRSGEVEEDVIKRLLRASELSAIKPDRNPKYYLCSRAECIIERSFTFEKDGYEGEVPEHYSVDLGENPTIEDAQRFLDAFDEKRRR